ESNENNFIRVQATATDPEHDSTSSTSSATAKVVDVAPTLSVSINASSHTDGNVLTASPTLVTDDAGAGLGGNSAITYHWQPSTNRTPFGKTSVFPYTTLFRSESNENNFIRVQATATDPERDSTSSTSSATAKVVDVAPTLSVTISGTDIEGQVL